MQLGKSTTRPEDVTLITKQELLDTAKSRRSHWVGVTPEIIKTAISKCSFLILQAMNKKYGGYRNALLNVISKVY